MQTANPARAALSNAVNAAIANGAPVYVNVAPDIIRLATMSESETLELLIAGNGAIRGVDRHDKRLAHFPAAYAANISRGLRMLRSKWETRDNRLGMLARPVDLSDWPECTEFDARFELARHVWCDAVRVSNGGLL